MERRRFKNILHFTRWLLKEPTPSRDDAEAARRAEEDPTSQASQADIDARTARLGWPVTGSHGLVCVFYALRDV